MRQTTYKVWGWLGIAVAATGKTNVKRQSGSVFFSSPLHNRKSHRQCKQCKRETPQTCQKRKRTQWARAAIAFGVNSARAATETTVEHFWALGRGCHVALRWPLEVHSEHVSTQVDTCPTYERPSCRMPLRQLLEARPRWSGRAIEGGVGTGVAGMDWGLAGKAPAVPHPPPPFSHQTEATDV